MADETCSDRLKILADETRLRVLRHLLAADATAGELQAETGVEQTLLSHHLRVLREHDLVTSERDGKHQRYRLADGVKPADGQNGINIGCCVLSFDSLSVLD